ncbi:MAG: VPLPA-CTERM sorting domain-containing protein [Bradyrhizobium sp.]|uniref:VPLPA-CTERM sorting domain-containing protein n=1 Tax=Bradyrhizobium sp. TaxID=376 RepID=UPI003D0E7B65
MPSPVGRGGIGIKWLMPAVFLVAHGWSAAVTAAIVRVEETALTYSGAWTTEAFAEYSGGTARYANFDVHDTGASAAFAFDGTGITWIGAHTFNGGLFEWVVDEGTAAERRGTVNTFTSGVLLSTSEVLADDLAPGTHHFVFRSLGISGVSFTSDVPSETYIDAFDITTAPVPLPAGAWSLATALGALGFARRRFDHPL